MTLIKISFGRNWHGVTSLRNVELLDVSLSVLVYVNYTLNVEGINTLASRILKKFQGSANLGHLREVSGSKQSQVVVRNKPHYSEIN